MASIGTDGTLHQHRSDEMVDVVTADDITSARPSDVDGVAVTEFLHSVMDLIIFDEVIMRMEEWGRLLEGERGMGRIGEILPADSEAGLAPFLSEEVMDKA